MTAATELDISPRSALFQSALPGNDDPLDLWVVLLNRLQNTNSTVDCWVEKLLGIIGLHMEWRGGMGNSIDALDSFIECSVLTSAFASSDIVGDLPVQCPLQ